MPMNTGVFSLIGLYKLIIQEEQVLFQRIIDHERRKLTLYAEGEDVPVFDVVPEAVIERLKQLNQFARQQAQQYELDAVEDRIVRLEQRLRPTSPTVNEVLSDLRTLKETIEDGIRFKYFYRYPDQKAKALLKFEADWSDVLAKFPSSRNDALAATDCYSMSQATASVFHSMRVLEVGLAALARAVGIAFTIQQWHNVINEIEAAIKQNREGPKSPTKDDELQFCSQAANDFRYFKDGWRNYVSHKRIAYDDLEALSALEHVRAFMTHLASRLSETS